MSKRNDIVSPETRSRMMRSVARENTTAERAVRSILRDLGVSYRLNSRSLPGSPDVSNKTRKWAIFVNGCFWHGHKNCPKTKGGREFRVPETRSRFWRQKLGENRLRDARKCRALRAMGFHVALVWECQLSREEQLRGRISRFLDNAEITNGK